VMMDGVWGFSVLISVGISWVGGSLGWTLLWKGLGFGSVHSWI
jgi:hypothetical protein